MRTPLVEGQIADQAKTHGIPEAEVVEQIMLARAAIKRLIEPEEVAEVVAYLCSPAAGVHHRHVDRHGRRLDARS